MDIRKYFLPPCHHPQSPIYTRLEVFHNRYLGLIKSYIYIVSTRYFTFSA